MSSTSPKKSQRCHLLALPREIRDQINSYVQWGQRINRIPVWLPRDYPINDMIWPKVKNLFERARLQERNPGSRFQPDTRDVLILTRTCKQLYDESSEIFYGGTIFSFKDTWDLYCYLYMIGPKKRACIRQLHFCFAGTHAVAAFHLLGECQALQSLKIGVLEQTMLGSKQPKKDLLTARGVGALKKIRGMENLVIDVVEIAQMERWNGWGPRLVSLSRPPLHPYFDPENVKGFARVLTDCMRNKADMAEKIQGGSSAGRPKLGNPKPMRFSKSRSLRSGRVQKSRLLPTRKVAQKGKSIVNR